MRQTLIILTIIVMGQLKCFATLQESDFLIWNNDTLFLNNSPLAELRDVGEKIREKEKFVSSGCWNGFIAEWTIIDSVLYLKNLYSYSTRKIINKRLERILDKKFENGMLRADWFTGEIIGGFGKYLHCMYFLVYEKERKFSFQNGSLINIDNFDAQNIDFSINEEKVEEFVYQNFDWEKFEFKLKFHKSSSVYIEADNSGVLKTIKFETSAGSEIDKEIERVLRLVPNWGIYYWNAEKYNFSHDYYFEFNNNKMKKYAR